VSIELEFDNIETIKQAIEVATGVSLLPKPTIERELASGALAMVPLDGLPLARPLGIIHRRDRKLSETAQRFVALLQSQASELEEPRAYEAPLLTETGVSETNGTMKHRVKAAV
jgi:DNA-binding transcriptional LysR family regulator